MALLPDPAVEGPEVELARVVLERLQVAAQAAVTGQLLRDAAVDVRADIADRLIVSLRSHVLAEHLASHTETATVEVPATWWDHWKADHHELAHWWSLNVRPLRPPRRVTHTLTVHWDDWAAFPHATIADDRLGAPVLWRQSRRSFYEAGP